MEKVAIQEVENSLQPAAVMRSLTGPLGLSDVAINYYELEPGDSFAFAYHNHEFQEEVFYIQSGMATFETEEGPVQVSAGELIRFAPGELQRGWNRGENRVIALGIGAPLKYGDGIKLLTCETCGDRTEHRFEREEGDEGPVRVGYCELCDTESGRWYAGSMPGDVP